MGSRLEGSYSRHKARRAATGRDERLDDVSHLVDSLEQRGPAEGSRGQISWGPRQISSETDMYEY